MRKCRIAPEQKTRGAVFTRPEVVEYMVREVMLAGGFHEWSRLHVLEPSCGEGAFVIPIVEALCAEAPDWQDRSLDGFLRAFDVCEESLAIVREHVASCLRAANCPDAIVRRLVGQWFCCADFLTHDFRGTFDVVIGNPPYIRFDGIPVERQRDYQTRYHTFTERCDIYVPFFERSLSLLSETGVLSFICTNRFVRSSYGKRLRRMIADNFHVALYLNMEHTQPFKTKVSAYPAIFVIDRRTGSPTSSGNVDSCRNETLHAFATDASDSRLHRFEAWYSGAKPWLTTDRIERDRLETVAQTFPTIEDSADGTRIGIGVASGADDIFLNPVIGEKIESECLLPIVASEDIRGGRISWDGRYILNPYDSDDDRLMRNLAVFPKTRDYLERNALVLKSRYCAKKHPDSWYRTLDRINYDILRSSKILVPDIQSGGNVALDEDGKYYPHHNVYWIVSRTWNMRVLCVIMRSTFVTEQMRHFSVQMRGGSIRYQAQNLRKVHIPGWRSLDEEDVRALAMLYDSSDLSAIDAAVGKVIEKSAPKQAPRIIKQEFALI